MPRRNRGGRRLFVLLFFFLFVGLLWWEDNQRNRTLATQSLHRDQETVITLTTSSNVVREGVYVQQKEKTFSLAPLKKQTPETELMKLDAVSEEDLISLQRDWTDVFEGSVENVSIAHYRLIGMNEMDRVQERMCSELTTRCQKLSNLAKMLQQGSSTVASSRLNILLADALAWTRQRYPELAVDINKQVAERLNNERSYVTFKGSDYVIVCLSQSCHQWANDFSASLAGDQGSRAIYVGIDVDVDQLKWPCPHRVINVDTAELGSVKQFTRKILKAASLMIEKRNRWICSDPQHPPNHFGEHTKKMGHGGIYYEASNFMICHINHSGIKQVKAMLKGLERMGSSRTRGNKQPSAVRYLNVDNNYTMTKAVYDNTSIVKAVFVQHPIHRLLSVYIEKILKKQDYSLLPGLEDLVRRKGIPSFASFVDFLISHHPDPYDPNLDPRLGIQSAMCGLKDHRFDFVGSVSDFDRSFKDFSSSLDASADYSETNAHEALKLRNFKASMDILDSKVSIYYTRDIITKVHNYYMDDFVHFGFTLDSGLSSA